MKDILFVCVHNSGRSQMAEAFLNKLTAGQMRALSAGTEPDNDVDPIVVKAMWEIGIDISKKKPKKLTFEMVNHANRIITMGCGVEGTCPTVFVETEDWNLADPKGQSLEKVKKIRDEIKIRVEELIKQLAP